MRALSVPLVFLLVILPLLPVAPAATQPAGAPHLEKALAVFPLAADRTVPLDAAVPTIPTTGGWIGPGAHLLMTMDYAPGYAFGCTANFIWTGGGKTYVGAAGHCFLPNPITGGPSGSAVATHGPGADYDPSHTHVRICVSGCEFGGQVGFIITGTTVALGPVAYARQTASDGDVGNDFGIVEVPTAQLPRVSAAMPVWGGPSTTSGAAAGQLGCFYGNAAGLGEVVATKARVGVVSYVGPKQWGAVLPSFEGDSGSALITCTASANGIHGLATVGILTHLTPGAVARPISGTTVPRAEQMATEAGLTIVPTLSP
jgi:hypothetical protein